MLRHRSERKGKKKVPLGQSQPSTPSQPFKPSSKKQQVAKGNREKPQKKKGNRKHPPPAHHNAVLVAKKNATRKAPPPSPPTNTFVHDDEVLQSVTRQKNPEPGAIPPTNHYQQPPFHHVPPSFGQPLCTTAISSCPSLGLSYSQPFCTKPIHHAPPGATPSANHYYQPPPIKHAAPAAIPPANHYHPPPFHHAPPWAFSSANHYQAPPFHHAPPWAFSTANHYQAPPSHQYQQQLLVKSEDEQFMAEYLHVYHIFAQMVQCHMTEWDRDTTSKQRLEVGFPGYCCKHCKTNRHFPPDLKSLSQNRKVNTLHKHVQGCVDCPQKIKDELVSLFESKKVYQFSGRRNGDLRKFYSVLWTRLHPTTAPTTTCTTYKSAVYTDDDNAGDIVDAACGKAPAKKNAVITTSSHTNTASTLHRADFASQLAEAIQKSREIFQQFNANQMALGIQMSKEEYCRSKQVQVLKGYPVATFKEMIESVPKDIVGDEDIACGVQSLKKIESQGLVRKANGSIDASDSNSQEKAQYGRILFPATERLLCDMLQLKGTDVFLDVGHGIGNAVFHAAYVHGCDARGIELISDRNALATAYRICLDELRSGHLGSRNKDYQIGSIKLVHGSIEDAAHCEFLTKTGDSRAIKAFCNNYNAVFSDRAAKIRTKIHLDDILAGLFAQMPAGSVLVTLHPLNMLPDRKTTESTRKTKGLQTPDQLKNVSFYSFEKLVLGKEKDCVSWSRAEIDLVVYKYTRLEQPTAEAVFLCSNASCQRAQKGEAIAATKVAEREYSEQNVRVMNWCNCNGISITSTRSCQQKVNSEKMG